MAEMVPPFGTVIAGQIARESAIMLVKLKRENDTATLRGAIDRIGPRHRLANRWHYDLKWEWDASVMRAWLDGETPDVTVVRKPGHG